MFSLAETRRIDADGVTFRSVYDGSVARFTPELAMAVQASLGSDIAMAFDECPPAGAARATSSARSSAPPLGRALRGRAAARGAAALRHRAGRHRPRAARALGRPAHGLPFDGYAIGGLSVGEEREEMFDVTASTAPLLPADRPRYFMGIGDPEGILRVIGAGIDMFDCVLPTRLGRTGSATTWEGRLNLAQRALRPRRAARCRRAARARPAARFSRAYIRHLVTQDELLGLRLLTLHNVSLPARVVPCRRAVRSSSTASGRSPRRHSSDSARGRRRGAPRELREA